MSNPPASPAESCAHCGSEEGERRARGLCNPCYNRLRKYDPDTLASYPRTTRSSTEVIEEYEFFTSYVRPGASARTAAAYLGMTHSALQRALERHRARQRARQHQPERTAA